MDHLPGYDAWLEEPYNETEPCEHECSECEGTGKAWIAEEERFSPTEPCEYCFESSGKCDGNCGPGDPPEWEPYDYE